VPFRYRCRHSLILMQDIVMHERMLPIDTVGDQKWQAKTTNLAKLGICYYGERRHRAWSRFIT